MNKQQRQQLVNDFNRWVAEKFLPEEESIEKGSAEWEAHLNRLTMMFAEFLFVCPEASAVELSEPLGFIHAYGHFVVRHLALSSVEDGEPSTARSHNYYVWPVGMYLYSHCGAEMN